MSILALKKELSYAQQLVIARGRPMVRRSLPALGILLIVSPGVIQGGSFSNAFNESHATGISMDVSYASVTHLNTPTTLSVAVTSVFGNSGQFSIRIENKFLKSFTIVRIYPEPLSTRTNEYETIYLFSALNNQKLTFTLIPKVIGKSRATLQYGLDPPVAFSINTVL